MAEIVMPRLSDSMEEGTIIRWLKEQGAQVARGDELVEIETDKATMTYEADAAGALDIVAQEGATLPIGEVIARIGEGAAPAAVPPETPAAPAAEPPAEEPAGEPEVAAPPADLPTDVGPVQGVPPVEEVRAAAPAPHGDGTEERVRASPVARRIARELGVELSGVSGTGPGGRIVKADVEAAAGPKDKAPRLSAVGSEPAPAPAAPAAPAAPPPAVTSGEPGSAKGEVTITEPTRTQSLIARRMAESRATIPTFTLRATVDMTQCVELRGTLKASGAEVLPSFNDLVVKACAIALAEHPNANGAYRDGKFERYARVNIGVAVAAEGSLVVPTIYDADRKGLAQIASETRALAERVRAGAITPPELSGGTFTVSNLGMYGVRSFEAVINPPQAAILSVGALEPRPVVRDGEVVVRQQMDIELACDHRILYGAQAAEFLARVRGILEAPLSLAL
jgi:pyruvate dehydrogenase E2 component (dihydrolipoamide acetyltransferase)